MKKLLSVLVFLFAFSLNAQYVLQDGFEQPDPCATVFPSGWHTVGAPLLLYSCGGYTRDHGTEPPQGLFNNHYAAIRTHDRTDPEGRDYLGHLLLFDLMPGDYVYLEAAVNHGELCRYATNGFGFMLGNDAWPVSLAQCSDDDPVLAIASVFETDSMWSTLGGFVTITERADRIMVGNFWCDEETTITQDTTLSYPKSVMNVDNVTVHVISTSSTEPREGRGELVRECDILGRPVTEGYRGVVCRVYLFSGRYYTVKSWQQ